MLVAAYLLRHITEAWRSSVAAPLGFGKTNILSRSFRHLHAPAYVVAWVSFDTRDNQFYRLLSYVLASLHWDNALKRAWRELLLEISLEDQGDHLLSDLIEVLSVSDNDLYLILDDSHHIRNPEFTASSSV
jgi:ATP/maltotriose-dependent transcriptional regulator MalT